MNHVLFECVKCGSHMSLGPLGPGRSMQDIRSVACVVCRTGTMPPARLVHQWEVNRRDEEMRPYEH